MVEHLKPKVAIAENVKGMIQGNAKGYVKLVIERFKEIGYRTQLFLVNAADCGVPQKRERVFFCALRDDIDKPKLVLAPKHRWISAGEAIEGCFQVLNNEKLTLTPMQSKYWGRWNEGEKLADCKSRYGDRYSSFNEIKLRRGEPSNCLNSHYQHFIHWAEPRYFTYQEWKRLGSFPDDYQAKTDKIGKYMIGMSVPPRMTEQVARTVIDQWLN